MSAVERLVQRTFVDLADALVADYDVISFLDTLAHQVAGLLEIDACGLALVDHHGAPNLIAASDEDSRMLELVQLQNSEGPCLDCYRTGAPVQCADLATADSRWPRFAPAARDKGFTAVHALPMRLRDTIIGALNLFSATSQPLTPDRLELGQALADVATIGIVNERTARQNEVVTEQLQAALNSRIRIEQAKGVLAERLTVSVDEAFAILRRNARASNQKLSTVAQAVIDGTAAIQAPPDGAS